MSIVTVMAQAQERWEESLREVGTLFLALAPLDATLTNQTAGHAVAALIFVILGVVLIWLATSLEKRRMRHA